MKSQTGPLLRILALGGVAGPAVLTIAIVICGALRPNYSHASQFVSELGARGTSRAALMNFAGFVPSGLFLAGFGVSLCGFRPRRLSSVLAAICTILFGLGLTLAGIYSCDPGCPHRGATSEAVLHHRMTSLAFLFGIAAVALMAYYFRGLKEWRDLWRYSALSSAAAYGFLMTSGASLESRSLTGLWQRLFLGTLFLWFMIVSRRTFRRGRFERQRAS